MSTVVSLNRYAALGNDPEQDSDREEVPVKVIDKSTTRSSKRNAPAEAPSSKSTAPPAEGRGGRRGGFSGNERAYNDRSAGSANNRGKHIEDAPEHRRERGEDRGGRGGRGGRQLDRHSRGVGGDSERQANHGWGAIEGGAELADEKAGEIMAQTEQKDALVNDGDAVTGAAATPAEAEPEDNSMSYADYMAQLAEKKLSLGTGVPEPRKPNEGSKQDKKWANAKAITKDEDEDFIAGAGSKAKRERERERKPKQVLNIDQHYVAPSDRGRGGSRGGRGGRGDGSFRGGRGEFRGGRGEGRERGGRDDYRGSRNGPRGGGSFNTEDPSAFPSLGS